jgi:flagella basal body P-ring formation protein FlgA
MCKLFNVISVFRLLRATLWGLGLVALSAGLHAQNAAGTPDVIETSQRWLNDAVSMKATGEFPLRMQVTVGALDSRLRLAPCARIEPYLPVGTRLWGRTRLGLRCTDGVAKWNVFLPVTVKAFGNAWVIKDGIAPGAVLSEADATSEEVDWAQETSPVVANPAQWVGQVTTRSLTAGQVLRQGLFKPAQVFQAGAQIRVVAHGVGFDIASDGLALSTGVIGQSARVRMDNGRILSGLVLDTRTVQIEM